MREVLVYTECWGVGGIERSVVNLIGALGGDRYSFHVFSTWGSKNFLSEKLECAGADQEILFEGGDPGLARRRIKSGRAVCRALSAGSFDVIHVNAMNGMELQPLKLAADNGVPVRIAHAHNSSFGPGARAAKTLMHDLGKKVFLPYATRAAACSEASARYLFGERDCIFLPNGIDADAFRFSRESRDRIRNRLGIPQDRPVLGSIGRCSAAKNPLFQIDIFSEFLKLCPDAIYLMVGSGELDSQVSAYAEEKGLGRSFIKLPAVPDAGDYYSALDLFLLPSLYEGLPYSVVEAQCSGLGVLAGDCLTRQCVFTPWVKTLPVTHSSEEWAREARAILGSRERGGGREEGYRAVERSPFSLCVYREKISELYEGR